MITILDLIITTTGTGTTGDTTISGDGTTTGITIPIILITLIIFLIAHHLDRILNREWNDHDLE